MDPINGLRINKIKVLILIYERSEFGEATKMRSIFIAVWQFEL
jgi:hypothetical protein